MKHARTALLLVAFAWAGGSIAQTAPAAAAPAVTATAVQSQNIMDVKPEASEAPGYAEQTNGERAKVQPGNNAPMWRQVGQGVTGYSSLPVTQAPEAGNLIQPFVQYPGSRLTSAGEAWRQVRNNWIIPYGAAFFSIALLALAIFYFTKGPLGNDYPANSRRMQRFTPLERAAHWANAIAFIALAVSGIVMALGQYFLLPVLGSTLFGWLAYVLKNVHNFMGPLFAVSLTLIVLIFVKDNIASKADFVWLSKAGGMLGDKEVPSHRFNAGEKGLFWWGVTIPGLIAVGSGLVLDQLVPGLGQFRSDMQIAHMIHSVMAFWIMALMLGHIYMGTIGTRGALEGMKTGYVTEGWAKEHHELWYNDVKSGKIPAERGKAAAFAAAAPAPTAQA